MELTSEQIRLLMMHEWLLDSNAMVASERINLACLSHQFHAYGIDLLPEKWQKMLEVEEEYFDYLFCLCSGVIGSRVNQAPHVECRLESKPSSACRM
ncbi:hypothetical protein KIN20_024052 [Parelaphostrongylus tenuis]|uniref:Uncharacterized protein n=1 Tax=Parelaphostrongylus tenuis TaxID=148309 RepID=A0AAD5MWI4_PARTN|nr:hypothetical protein KIN20_024052 [Parelaphostrongylus tenuis]